MTFNLLFVLHHFDVFVHLLEGSQNDGLTFFIVLGATRSTKDLLDIENANIFVPTSWTIIHFGTFDQYCVGWKIDTPS